MKTLIAAAGAALLCLAAPAAAQPVVDWSKVEITTTDLGNGVYLLGWPQGDSLALVGPDGVLLLDTSVPQMIGKIRAEIARLSDKPVRWVVNAHAHADHFGGNAVMAEAGATIIGHEALRERMRTGWYIAPFNQTVPPQAPAALPSITYDDRMTIRLWGETIELIHAPAAHTDTDSIVFFRRANVIHFGGSFTAGSTYPFYDMGTGGSLKGVIAAHERVLALIDEQTRVIADEGAPEGKAQVRASYEMLTTLRDRVQKLIDEGRTEEEAVAAKPTADLDAKWVPRGAFLTGDFAVRMAYQSLKGIKPPTQPPPARPR